MITENRTNNFPPSDSRFWTEERRQKKSVQSKQYWTEERRQEKRELQKNYWTPERREEKRLKMLGISHPMSEQGKENVRQAIIKMYDKKEGETGQRGTLRPERLGKTLEEIYGEEKGFEIRKKMSSALIGIPKPQGHGVKVSKALKGITKSEEHKRKLGGPRTEEEKQHMREAAAKRTAEDKKIIRERYQRSLDANGGRERIRATWKGKKRSEQQIQGIVERRAKAKYPFNNTKPEVAVQRYLQSNLVQFETHKRLDFYKLHAYDIVINDKKTVIEIDGCYWHGCLEHYPSQNIEQSKRDLLHTSVAEQNGWKCIRIWEHEIKSGEFSKLNALMEGRNG